MGVRLVHAELQVLGEVYHAQTDLFMNYGSLTTAWCYRYLCLHNDLKKIKLLLIERCVAVWVKRIIYCTNIR